MAGYANNKERAKGLEEENARLKRELARFQATQPLPRRRIVSREYDENIVSELITWSEEGQFIDECLASWGIDAETFGKWCEEHVELKVALGPARARAKASMLRTLREALRTRTAFPTSLADRIITMVERENKTTDESASGLVRLTFCPHCLSADQQSAEAKG